MSDFLIFLQFHQTICTSFANQNFHKIIMTLKATIIALRVYISKNATQSEDRDVIRVTKGIMETMITIIKLVQLGAPGALIIEMKTYMYRTAQLAFHLDCEKIYDTPGGSSIM